MKVRKKLLGLLAASAMLVSILVPLPAMALDYNLYSSAIISIDNSSDNNIGTSFLNGNTSDSTVLLDIRNAPDKPNGRHREAYLQFDFSEYRDELLAGYYESIQLSLTPNTNGFGAATQWEVYLLTPEMARGISTANLPSHKAARDQGYTSYTDQPVWTLPAGSADKTPHKSGEELENALIQYFQENPEETVVGFRLALVKGTTAGVMGPKNANEAFRPQFILTESPIVAEVTSAAEQLKASLPNTVAGDISLPSTIAGYDGIGVTWEEASDPEYLDIDGSASRPAYGESDRAVTLTAKVFSEDSGRDIKKQIKCDFTVSANRANPYYEHNSQTALDAAYVSASQPGTVMNDGQLKADDTDEKVSFLKFDLSACRNQLDSLDSIRLRMIPYPDGVNSGEKSVGVYITGQNNWDGETLTYQAAQSSGIMDGAEQIYQAAVTFDETGIYYVRDILPAVKDYFAENPGSDGKLTIMVRAAEGSAFSFYHTSAPGDDLKPSMICISYQDAVTETKDHITPEQISQEDIHLVRSNLNLFSSWEYSPAIRWSSSNEAVISPAGVVTRPAEDTPVTLTATITGGTAAPETVTIPVIVRGTQTDWTYLTEQLAGLSFRTIITSDFTLPVTIETDLETLGISWKAEDPYVTEVDGGKVKVRRLKGGECVTKITGTLTLGGVAASRDFTFTILRDAENDLLAKKTVLDPGGTKANAIDDNTETVWTPDGDRTITIDLKTQRVLSRFLVVYDGQPATGLKIETSQGKEFIHKDVYTSEALLPETANEISFSIPVYAQYVRITCAGGMEGIRFIGAYAGASEEEGGADLAESLRKLVDEQVTSGFTLPSRVADYEITDWSSSDTNYIAINGYSATVTRPPSSFGKSGAEVNLTAQVQTGSGIKSVMLPVVVPKQPGGSGSSGSSSGGSKGGGNGSSGTVMLPNVTPAPTPTPTPAPGPFEDLDSAKWAEPYIISLNKKGIISGKGNGTFDPNGSLKREEMAKMLVTAFSLSGDAAEIPFEDVKPDDWYYEYVGALYQSGMTDGVSEDQFGVGADITRQDAAVQLARLLNAKGVEAGAEEAESFSDDEAIAEYAKQGVAMLRSLGIISGDGNGAFQPQSNITRAEIAKIIYLALAL